MKRSNLQWSFSNNNTSASQFLSFKSVQDEGGSHNKYPLAFSQRNLGLDTLRGSQYTGHQWQPKDVLSANPLSEIRSSPATNQIIPATISSAIAASPPIGPVVGSTDLKSSSGISTGPCQLTIFYNGAVCVYDNVSPEKAQAIMLLAGYSESKNSTASSTAAVPSPIPSVQPAVLKRPQAIETAVLNQSAGFSSSVSLVMPVTASSTAAQVSLPHVQPASVLKPQAIETTVINQSAGFSSSVSLVKPVISLSTVEVNPIKSVAVPAQIKCPEPPKSDAVAAAGSAQTPSAVPQARKASLARFLEKRKERVTAASPYVVSKNGSQCSNIEPGGSTLPGNLSSSSLLPASN